MQAATAITIARGDEAALREGRAERMLFASRR
jgi:hypothetical protein